MYKSDINHINKLYIISKCTEVYEGCPTLIKRSLLIAIKFLAMLQIKIIYHLLIRHKGSVKKISFQLAGTN